MRQFHTSSWFASSLSVVFNSHDFMYVPFKEWLEKNIINADEDIIVQVLALRYEIWCTRNKKCFEENDVDVATIQKAQKSIVNFKSASTVVIETLSGGPILSIFDVHWTPLFSGFYKLNVDVVGPMDGGKWSVGVVARDNEGVVLASSS